MTEIQNPTALSDYDWMEFVGFTWKVENEGYEYASENYPPRFEDEALQARIDEDERELKKLYREHSDKVEQWAETVGWERSSDLWDAHRREEKERKERHLLWALHPGGKWNYAVYSEAFESRELAEEYIAKSDRTAEKYPASFRRCDWRLLHRDVPGGEWTEVPFERTT